MRFYIGDKVLPKTMKTKDASFYGVITNLSYRWEDQKPVNENDIEYSITWLDKNTKEFVNFTKAAPKNAWWNCKSLKKIRNEDEGH